MCVFMCGEHGELWLTFSISGHSSKRVSSCNSVLLAKQNRSQTHFARKCALPIKRSDLF